MYPMSLGCVYLPQGKLGVKGQPPYGSLAYSISFADINIIPQCIHCLYNIIISGKVLREIKESSVLLQFISPHTYTLYIISGESLYEVRGHT